MYIPRGCGRQRYYPDDGIVDLRFSAVISAANSGATLKSQGVMVYSVVHVGSVLSRWFEAVFV